MRITSLQTDLTKEPFVTGHSVTQSESGDVMQSAVAGLDDENYAYSSEDEEEQEQSALFDEEDQVFFSDTDEAESAAPCSNGYVNNDEVSGTTTFAIVNTYMYTKFEYLMGTCTCKHITLVQVCHSILEKKK